MAVMFAAAATLMISLPHRIEMISLRGCSSSASSESARGWRLRLSSRSSSRDSEKSAVSELEKNAEAASSITCNTRRSTISVSCSSVTSKASNCCSLSQ